MNQSNASYTPSLSPLAYALPTELSIFTVTLCLNTLVLIIFLTDHAMRRNPFITYLINLNLANLFHATVGVPLKLILTFDPHQPHTHIFCEAYIFARFSSDTLMMQCHVLITTNRLWAVLFPISYQQKHKKTTAKIICALPWVYINLFVLPGLIVDGVLYRTPKDNVLCVVNAANLLQQRFIYAMVGLFYIAPLCIIVTAYPLIWYWRFRRRRIGTLREVFPEDDGEGPARRPRVPTGQSLRSVRSRSFLVLTLLTGCVCVCWTPQVINYCLILFFRVRRTRFSVAVELLWSLQPALDPILFAMALRGFREKVGACRNRVCKPHRITTTH
ncbi:D(1B) dopamine receptor-like [Paramacrobiotus metropolitanus]|uniref:D(1B) dopamine receptor-like n=1 Tax=Paramacrobiotus metropolitanus TaxID=2943436 RepID=UPI0024461370|nr:D(1B) dopamine receptor-like [Paramacrobiotus metropolitanus]